MHPMPLPHFLLMLVAVILAGGLSIWAATQAGVPFALIGLGALMAAGLVRLLARVE